MDREDLDELFSASYEELRRLARSVRSDDPRATLEPTALVHEAWMRLARSPRFESTSPLHFKRIAARAMRRVLVDSARRRHAEKRGGQATWVTFDEAMHVGATTAADVLALDASLARLALASPRQAAMLEARFFAGLEVAETAELLGVSESTVLRDWRAARAWLALDMRRAGEA